MSSITKRLRSALRMGSCEVKQIDMVSNFDLYVQMDIKLWIPGKDIKQAQKLLQEMLKESNARKS